MFLLKNSDFSFISHDSVLKLNDIRTVSVNRILYQQHGVIPLSSDTYKKIEELVLQKYFPSFMYEYANMEQKLSNTEATLSEKEEALQALSTENEGLKRQIEELNKKLSNTDNQ
jgi:chromosome segregation ATPase